MPSNRYLSDDGTPLPLDQLDDRAFRDLLIATQNWQTGVRGTNGDAYLYLSGARDGLYAAPDPEAITRERNRRTEIGQRLAPQTPAYQAAVRGDYGSIQPFGSQPTRTDLNSVDPDAQPPYVPGGAQPIAVRPMPQPPGPPDPYPPQAPPSITPPPAPDLTPFPEIIEPAAARSGVVATPAATAPGSITAPVVDVAGAIVPSVTPAPAPGPTAAPPAAAPAPGTAPASDGHVLISIGGRTMTVPPGLAQLYQSLGGTVVGPAPAPTGPAPAQTAAPAPTPAPTPAPGTIPPPAPAPVRIVPPAAAAVPPGPVAPPPQPGQGTVPSGPAPRPAAPVPGQSPVRVALSPPDAGPFFRGNVVNFETGGHPDPTRAQNPNSSAYGETQITRGRYDHLRLTYGATNPWMPATFEAFKAAGGDMERRVYELVHGPDTARALTSAGLPVTASTFLATHFLGNDAGPRFLRGAMQNPGAPVSEFVSPEALAANRSVFYDGTRMRTAGETLAEIQRRGRINEGALSAGRGDQPPVQAPPQAGPVAGPPAAGQTADNGPESNPYRARLFEMLKKIEGERGGRPQWGEVLFRMGTGMLSPDARGFHGGLAKGGELVADYLKEVRGDQARRDATLVQGYNALSNDRTYARANAARDNFRGVTLEGRDPQGRPTYLTGRFNSRTGLYEVTGQDGQWTPAPGGVREVNRSQNDPYADLGGIPGASYVNPQTGEPTFHFGRADEAKNYGYSTTAIYAAQNMAQMEAAGYNPTNLAAITARIASSPDGRIDPTQILNSFTDPRDRQYAGYLLTYTNAVARQQSGAAIGVSEWQRYGTMFAGTLGDDPETRAIRGRTREEHIRGLIGGSGPAAPYLQDVLGGRRSLPTTMTPQFAQPTSGGQGGGQTGGPTGGQSGGGNPPAAPTVEGEPLPPETFRGTPDQIRASVQRLDPRKTYAYGGRSVTGARLREIVLEQLRQGGH